MATKEKNDGEGAGEAGEVRDGTRGSVYIQQGFDMTMFWEVEQIVRKHEHSIFISGDTTICAPPSTPYTFSWFVVLGSPVSSTSFPVTLTTAFVLSSDIQVHISNLLFFVSWPSFVIGRTTSQQRLSGICYFEGLSRWHLPAFC